MGAVQLIRPVSYAELMTAPEFPALIAEYGAECSIPEIGSINPQPQMYAALEHAGAFHCFGAYDGESLVGFSTVLVTPSPHYGKLLAVVESLFLSKAHRTGALGRALMVAVESLATEKKCAAIGYSAKTGSQLERLLYLKREYIPTNTVFMRQL